MRHKILIATSLAFLSACTGLQMYEEGLRGVRILCGFADVIIREADIPKIKEAFADSDSFGKQTCRAVFALSQQEQNGEIPVSDEEDVAIILPSGEAINIRVLPPTTK